MGYCVTGRVVVAPNQTQERAVYYSSQPQVTYQASAQDVAYWGTSYTTLDGYWSFAPGYRVFQSDEAGCKLGIGSRYDCINGVCVQQNQYNTPGEFASLEECQAGCGGGGIACAPPNICVPPDHCPEGYVCIADFEWTEIKRLLS